MTNEERIKVYEDTISILKKDFNSSKMYKATVYKAEYDFSYSEQKYDTNFVVDDVLGAWSAGAFGHNAYNIAKLFQSVIAEEFEGCFRTIVFAVLDNTEEKVKVRAFEDVFRENNV